MDAIIGFIQMIADFVGTLIDSVVFLVSFLPQNAAVITAGFAYLPPFLVPFMTLSLAATLLFAVIRLI